MALCTAILLLLAFAAIADERTKALDGEPKLSKAITLSLRAASLKEVLASVEKATGVHLLVQRDIAEDKATVWVKDQPAREVLRALAHCFNLCWSPSPSSEKQYLRLWMDRGYLASMHHRIYQDTLSLASQYDTQLKALAEYVRSGLVYSPDEAMMVRLKKEDYQEHVRQLKKRDISADKCYGAAVLQFVTLSNKQRDSLFAGNHITASGTDICAEALQKWPAAKSFDYALERNISGYTLRCGARPGTGSYNIATGYHDDLPYHKEADLAAKQILADPALDKDLPAPDPNALADVSIHLGEGSCAVPATMSDGLLEIAMNANIPIVAQYVSEYNGANTDWDKGTVSYPVSTAKKVEERLAELGKQHVFAVSRDGEFLLGKSLLWHRFRSRELPEVRIRSLQKEFCGLPIPTFNAFVDMGSLRWEQIRGIIDNCRFWFGPQRMLPLAECEYALKIYGTLTTDQKQWLASGAELPASALTPDQQMIFMSGFEARENPTYENAGDQNWPNTASFLLRDNGFATATLFAVAKMRPVGDISPDEGALKVPAGTAQEDISKILNKQIEALFPSLKAKLLAKIAKEHPEIAAKDVSLYCLRYCSFVFKVGDHQRECYLAYCERLK
jgi:hypothetical protein